MDNMNANIDLSQYSIRTDLAIEAREMVIADREGLVQQGRTSRKLKESLLKKKI